LQANLADVGMAAAGCLNFSNTGPPMTVYPAGAWQQPTSTDDIDQMTSTRTYRPTTWPATESGSG
jgi:(2Fe-2S) ferredoxin